MPDRKSVIGKVELILDALADDGGRVGLSALARASGLPKASVHRICGDLVKWGVVERRADSFQLGPRLYELGARVPSSRRLRDTALPFLEELLVATEHTVHLAVPSGDGVFYVDKLVVHSSQPTPFAAAAQMPIHATATGKVILAFGPPTALVDALARPLEAMTANTLTDPVLLSEELDRTVARGYAVEQDELVDGFSSVAAPIRGYAQRLIGAISVTSVTAELSIARVAPMVSATAEAISRKLGAPDPGDECEPVGR